MRVKNINGMSQIACECDSWLRHWEIFGGFIADFCCEVNCLELATVGVHVQKANSTDDSWYIVPLCKKHNNQRWKELTLCSGTKLISANISLTCENTGND